jgi:hypothetical protein
MQSMLCIFQPVFSLGCRFPLQDHLDAAAAFLDPVAALEKAGPPDFNRDGETTSTRGSKLTI